MLNPHYIRISPQTYSQIKAQPALPNLAQKKLEELYKDSVEADTPYYLYFYRQKDTGFAGWLVYEPKELEEEFDIKEIDPRTERHFVRIY